jgi:SAM-dependent methyltransferase
LILQRLGKAMKSMVGFFHQHLVQQRRQERLSQHLAELAGGQPGLSVLDVGCGSGQIAANLGRRLNQAQIEGVDVLVRPNTYIPVRPFDGQQLPFPDGSFDYVLLVDVLHHTLDPQEVLRECLRVSRRGVWLKDHLCNSAWDRFRLRVLDWVGNWGHGVALPYNYLSGLEWKRVFFELKVTPRRWRQRLGMYPEVFRWLLEGSMNFVTWLEPDAEVAD